MRNIASPKAARLTEILWGKNRGNQRYLYFNSIGGGTTQIGKYYFSQKQTNIKWMCRFAAFDSWYLLPFGYDDCFYSWFYEIELN